MPAFLFQATLAEASVPLLLMASKRVTSANGSPERRKLPGVLGEVTEVARPPS